MLLRLYFTKPAYCLMYQSSDLIFGTSCWVFRNDGNRSSSRATSLGVGTQGVTGASGPRTHRQRAMLSASDNDKTVLEPACEGTQWMSRSPGSGMRSCAAE